MLEKMRNKVEEDESLAQAYGQVADIDKSVDNEIDAALSQGNATANDSLAALKAKMGISA
jgi:phage shock protein A